MFLELMCLEVHLRRKYDEFLLLALPLHTHVMILLKVVLQRLIVDVVVRIPAICSVAQEAPLMILPTMHIELIVTIKPLSTEATQRVAFEATLVLGPWVVVSLRHMQL